MLIKIIIDVENVILFFYKSSIQKPTVTKKTEACAVLDRPLPVVGAHIISITRTVGNFILTGSWNETNNEKSCFKRAGLWLPILDFIDLLKMKSSVFRNSKATEYKFFSLLNESLLIIKQIISKNLKRSGGYIVVHPTSLTLLISLVWLLRKALVDWF